VTDEPPTRSETWKLILTRNCKKQLAQLRREYPHTKSLFIPYSEVVKFGSIGLELSDEILESPGKAIEDIKDSITQNKLIETDKHEGAKDINPRFINLPRKTSIKNLREKHIGTLLAIEVQVKRVSDILPRCIEGVFRCPAGHFTYKKQGYNTFVVPDRCSTDSCTFKKLEFVEKRSEKIDTQRILVQEIPDNAHGGEQPKTMSAEFMGELCGTVFPGDRVVINAILRSYQVTKAGQLSPVFRTYLDVNNVEIFEREYEEVEITEEEEHIIKALAKDKDILNKIARSIAPTVYGMEPFKRALALSLFGGKQAHNQYGETKRMDIHVLGCGDPAIAKSKIARYACKIAPRSVITTGMSSTEAGLTVTVTRDDDGRFVADAGSMVLADLGVHYIEELGDLAKPKRAILHEAMEEQTSSYAKAGLVGSYNTRCASWATMNPGKGGKFDRYEDLASQVGIEAPLLSRFDFICLMCDDPSPIHDAGVADAILDDDEVRDNVPVRNDIIPADILRKYVATSKKKGNPIFSPEAKKILKDYYLKIRNSAKEGAPTPITARTMDTLKRVCIALANIRLSDIIIIRDAESAVNIVDDNLKDVCTDPKTGQRDVGRIGQGTSQEKLNRIGTMMEIIRDNPKISKALLLAKMSERSYTNERAILDDLKRAYEDGEIIDRGRNEHYECMEKK